MARCRFQFDFPGKAEALVEAIRLHASRIGGVFDGSESEGSLLFPTSIGTFRGTYSVSGQTIFVEVEDKPFFIPCRAIQAKLAEYIRDAL